MDVVCIDDCVLDVGQRSGAAMEGYLVEYVNVGLPTAVIRHLVTKVDSVTNNPVSPKKPNQRATYTWMNVGVQNEAYDQCCTRHMADRQTDTCAEDQKRGYSTSLLKTLTDTHLRPCREDSSKGSCFHFCSVLPKRQKEIV